jgi:glyoxylate carboligase
VPQKGEVASLVSKLVYNLHHRNQSRFTGLIQFVVHDERIIHISIACLLYVSQSGMVMLSVLGYLENEFCFS